MDLLQEVALGAAADAGFGRRFRSCGRPCRSAAWQRLARGSVVCGHETFARPGERPAEPPFTPADKGVGHCTAKRRNKQSTNERMEPQAEGSLVREWFQRLLHLKPFLF